MTNGERVRAIRNRILRAVHENNASVIAAAMDRLTPAELRQLAEDAVSVAWCVRLYLDNRPDLQTRKDDE